MTSGRRLTLAHCALLIVCLLLVLGVVDAALAQPFGISRSPASPSFGPFTGWILAKQAEFYRMLSGAIRAAKANGSAAWGLMARDQFADCHLSQTG
jgi:nickel/cobalt exporter